MEWMLKKKERYKPRNRGTERNTKSESTVEKKDGENERIEV